MRPHFWLCNLFHLLYPSGEFRPSGFPIPLLDQLSKCIQDFHGSSREAVNNQIFWLISLFGQPIDIIASHLGTTRIQFIHLTHQEHRKAWHGVILTPFNSLRVDTEPEITFCNLVQYRLLAHWTKESCLGAVHEVGQKAGNLSHITEKIHWM
jgi:hypothetical protein